MAGLLIITLLLISAFFATIDQAFFHRTLISRILYDPLAMDINKAMQGPSLHHPFGLDKYGRDILARMIYGSKVAVEVGVITTGIATILGVLVGSVAGYYGGWVDDILMRLMEILYSIPTLVLALAIMAAFGPSLKNAMIAVGIIQVPSFARVIRSQVLTVKERDYIIAAKAYYASDTRILLHHIIPNSIAPTIVQATLSIGGAILTVASLSFLGFGIQPPTPSWGRLLSEGRDVLLVAPHIATFPGIAILLTVLGFNLLGDGLRDALDPRLRGNV